MLSTKPYIDFLVLINSGASLDIANILYLLFCDTGSALSIPFFNIKNVSSSTLFLSDEGKLSHILPSLASYILSIAKL